MCSSSASNQPRAISMPSQNESQVEISYLFLREIAQGLSTFPDAADSPLRTALRSSTDSSRWIEDSHHVFWTVDAVLSCESCDHRHASGRYHGVFCSW